MLRVNNMTNYELASLFISAISLCFSLFAFFSSRKTEATQVELYINERITNTKEKVSEQANIIAPLKAKKDLSAEEQRLKELYEAGFNAAVENNLNAYEEACAKYLDGKADRNRFKKSYKKEIKQLVEMAA